jgi:hypothetical protein
MNNSHNEGGTTLSCPVCDQLVSDPTKIRPDLARALVIEQMWGSFIHEAGTHLVTMFGYLELIMNKPAIREDPESRQFLEKALNRIQDHRTFLDEQLDFFLRLKNDIPLTEHGLITFHRDFDARFHTRSKLRLKGLKGQSFETQSTEYRIFLQTMMELALIAVGRLRNPRVEIDYRATEDHANAELTLFEAGEVDLSNVHLQVAALIAAKSKLALVTEVVGTDRVFRWRLPFQRNVSDSRE